MAVSFANCEAWMFIHEAARNVLLELGGPAHVTQICELIISKELYNFGAKEPESALAIELSRKSSNVNIGNASSEKLFYRVAPATYGLAEWLKVSPTGNQNCTEIESDIQAILACTKEEATTKEQLVLARIGQGRFRESVLAGWNYRCAVTGSSLVVRASHIKPWRVSNDFERLDPNNGLPLVATLDALFDAHLITFNRSGSIELSTRIPEFERSCLGIANDMKLRRAPSPEMQKYLEKHREIFAT